MMNMFLVYVDMLAMSFQTQPKGATRKPAVLPQHLGTLCQSSCLTCRTFCQESLFPLMPLDHQEFQVRERLPVCPVIFQNCDQWNFAKYPNHSYVFVAKNIKWLKFHFFNFSGFEFSHDSWGSAAHPDQRRLCQPAAPVSSSYIRWTATHRAAAGHCDIPPVPAGRQQDVFWKHWLGIEIVDMNGVEGRGSCVQNTLVLSAFHLAQLEISVKNIKSDVRNKDCKWAAIP